MTMTLSEIRTVCGDLFLRNYTICGNSNRLGLFIAYERGENHEYALCFANKKGVHILFKALLSKKSTIEFRRWLTAEVYHILFGFTHMTRKKLDEHIVCIKHNMFDTNVYVVVEGIPGVPNEIGLSTLGYLQA